MVQVCPADLEEVGASLDAADVMKELVRSGDAFADEVHELFHALALGELGHGRSQLCFP